MVTESSIGILAGKRPLDAASFGVALTLPRVDLALRGRSVHQPPPEALTLKEADLDLRHVQPAGQMHRPGGDNLNTHFRSCFEEVLGRSAAGALLRRIQFHHTPKLVLGIRALKELPHERDELGLGAAFGDLEHPTPALGLDGHEHIAGPCADVFVVVSGRVGGCLVSIVCSSRRDRARVLDGGRAAHTGPARRTSVDGIPRSGSQCTTSACARA